MEDSGLFALPVRETELKPVAFVRGRGYVSQVYLRLFFRAARTGLAGTALLLLFVASREDRMIGGRAIFLIAGALFLLELGWFAWRIWFHRRIIFRPRKPPSSDLLH